MEFWFHKSFGTSQIYEQKQDRNVVSVNIYIIVQYHFIISIICHRACFSNVSFLDQLSVSGSNKVWTHYQKDWDAISVSPTQLCTRIQSCINSASTLGLTSRDVVDQVSSPRPFKFLSALSELNLNQKTSVLRQQGWPIQIQLQVTNTLTRMKEAFTSSV